MFTAECREEVGADRSRTIILGGAIGLADDLRGERSHDREVRMHPGSPNIW